MVGLGAGVCLRVRWMCRCDERAGSRLFGVGGGWRLDGRWRWSELRRMVSEGRGKASLSCAPELRRSERERERERRADPLLDAAAWLYRARSILSLAPTARCCSALLAAARLSLEFGLGAWRRNSAHRFLSPASQSVPPPNDPLSRISRRLAPLACLLALLARLPTEARSTRRSCSHKIRLFTI